MTRGLNQYPPMPGVPVLREAIAAKLQQLHGRSYNPNTEITVTAGATQALITAVLAVVHPGDEVIVLEPCYDSYVPNIELAGGIPVRVPLTPGTFRPDFDRISAAITPKTRAIIINSPHNPSATVWTREDMLRLQEILAPTDVLLISDEVYEHMVFDAAQGRVHESAARFPGLAARAVIVSSFGKTYHVTGWKIGYVAAPASLTTEFRKVHQFNVFTVNTPMQYGLASYMADAHPYLDLPAFYQRKRDLFRAGLAKTRFKLLPSEGSYFQCVDISQVSDLGEADFCKWLTTEIGVAAMPGVPGGTGSPLRFGGFLWIFEQRPEPGVGADHVVARRGRGEGAADDLEQEVDLRLARHRHVRCSRTGGGTGRQICSGRRRFPFWRQAGWRLRLARRRRRDTRF